jgi:hypothetical protein
LTVAHARVVVPLAGLQPTLDVDQLSLRQELAADLGQPVPGDQVVVLGPLRRPVAAELVGGDHEIGDRLAARERAQLRVAGQPAYQKHLVHAEPFLLPATRAGRGTGRGGHRMAGG